VAYSTFTDVKSIVDTDMSDAEVTNVITWIDALIDLTIDSGTAGAVFLEALSATWSAYRVMLKDPNARSLGEYSENRAQALKYLKDEIDFMLAIGGGGINFVAASESLA